MERLIHCSRKPLTKIETVKQTNNWRGFKPMGLWFSDDSEDSWQAWCRSEGCFLKTLVCQTEIIFKPDAKILRLATHDEVVKFAKEYEVPLGLKGYIKDWAKVAEKYDAIIIAPYQYSLRLAKDMLWYYAWDCASGCVWNAEAVKELRPLLVEA